MTTQPLLPFRTSRKNHLFTCVVIAAAGIVTAGIAATLQPAHADTGSAPVRNYAQNAVLTGDTIMLPPALVVASADPADGSRRFRGPDRDGRQGETRPERPEIDKKLTNDQVRDIVAGRLAQSGNPNLKVGKVTAKQDGVVAVDITTKTGSLVETQEISTKTGLPAKLERRLGEMRERFRGHGQGGPRMMAHRGGRGPGMTPGAGEKRDLALTTDQAKKLAEARLILRGNPHLKVGAVKEKDADTISIDIVAADNSLVSQQLIDRHSGRPQRPDRS